MTNGKRIVTDAEFSYTVDPYGGSLGWSFSATVTAYNDDDDNGIVKTYRYISSPAGSFDDAKKGLLDFAESMKAEPPQF